ncbi:MAG: DNA topoisomerase IV subunit B [Alphaproteobacteria bacterium]
MARAPARNKDLFDSAAGGGAARNLSGRSAPGDGGAYSAKDIEVLEGLEPVRRRPGMYIGGTDERALHHLFAEVLDNAMDEAVAGHATYIEVDLAADGTLSVTDNGRGIPVDPHPKFKDKSALEVIMTMLHSGGKFGGKAYETSGGLHGVGVSVVNALSDRLEVEVARAKTLYRQTYAKGHPTSKLKNLGAVNNRRGTKVSFHPDPEIFGKGARFKPARLYRMARSKAYLFGGVEIRWSCASALITDETPAEDTLHFERGLQDFLSCEIQGATMVTDEPFVGKVAKGGSSVGGSAAVSHGSVEWAIAWVADRDGFLNTYCNTIPTTEGGTHEAGLRTALARALKGYAELTGNKKGAQILPDDIVGSAAGLLSVFIREPEFQGQTKEKLASAEAQRLVEAAVRDHFDHWLADSPPRAKKLLDWVVERSEERLRRRQEKEIGRQSATRKLRLPGKLADCADGSAKGTELFLVEGDSAGGSAKQARDRNKQAVLPLRGKILNVASAGTGKLSQNQELTDLVQALGCATREKYRDEDLRYDRVIIMTDADVDGAHIASLLITFFYKELPGLIAGGHLYLAVPPLYRLSHGGKIFYARDDMHKDALLKKEFSANAKVEISRFKGLGEMLPAQLKETTMKPGGRTLLKVIIPEGETAPTETLVEQLMGRKAELRFQYIQENAQFATDLDI